MFVAMSLALPLYMFLTRNDGKQRPQELGTKQETTPLVNGHVDYDRYSPSDPFGDKMESSTNNTINNSSSQQQQQQPEKFNIFSWELMKLLMAPSLFDLLGTALSTIGLLYVPVSLYQLSRCSVIIVTAIFKRVILKHHLTKSMYAGVTINAIAMLLVGSAAIILDTGAAPAEGLVQGGKSSQVHTSADMITGFRSE
eukprot:UN02869